MADRQPRSGRRDLALGRVGWRLTSVGKAIAFATAFSLLQVGTTPIFYGPVVAMVFVLVVDAALGARRISALDMRLIPVRNRAAAPDLIVHQAMVTSGDWRGLFVELGKFEVGYGPAVALTSSETRVGHDLGMPGSQTVIRYRMSGSVLGFVISRREAVQLLGQRIAQAPPAHEGRIPSVVSERVEELERLRPYTAGDRPNRVNWNATARTGELHVRDDMMVADEVVIVAEIGVHDVTVDMSARVRTVAAMTRLAVEEAWRGGCSVRLVTRHTSEAAVRHHALAQASAIDSAFGQGTKRRQFEGTIRDEYVADLDELIERLAGLAHGPDIPLPSPPFLRVSKEGVWRA